MPKSQVFACLDAISNRYGREADAYKKAGDGKGSNNVTDIDAMIKNNPQQLRALGATIL